MDILLALQSLASPPLDAFMLTVTGLGSQLAYVVLLVVVFLGVDARVGRTLGLAVATTFYLNQVFKGVFDTARPFLVDPALARSEEAVATAIGPGFPSGHAQSTSTFWGLAAAHVRRPWFTLLALAVVALVALSRIYLGVHFPIDVLGGLALGAAVVAVVLLAERARFRPGVALQLLLGLALPLALQLIAPTPDSDLILATFSAFATGPLIVRHHTDGPLWGRVLLAALGLLLALGYLFGSSVALPEEIKRDPLWGFARYLGLGYLVTVALPMLGRWTRLVPAAPSEA